MITENPSLVLESLIDQLVDQVPSNSSVLPSSSTLLHQDLVTQLTHFRRHHREAFANAHIIKQKNLVHREAALNARIAKLNRDWYKSHLEADISSYEGADLEFNPDDLISVNDLQQWLSPQELNQLSSKEIMIKRFQHERLARLRAYGQVTQKQNAKKSLQSEMLAALAKEEAMERAILNSIQHLEDVAKSHGIHLEPLPQEPLDVTMENTTLEEGEEQGETLDQPNSSEANLNPVTELEEGENMEDVIEESNVPSSSNFSSTTDHVQNLSVIETVSVTTEELSTTTSSAIVTNSNNVPSSNLSLISSDVQLTPMELDND